MKALLKIFLIFLISFQIQAQNDNLYILEIQNYISKVDSIDNAKPADFKKSTADGVIKRSDGENGGFGIETLSDKNDSIYKISYQGGIDLYVSKTYYYKSNKLVFVILEVANYSNKLGTIYSRKEFYRKDKVISSRILINKLNSQNRYIVDFSLLEDGITMYNDQRNMR